jgi:hypothetical protein
LNNHERSNSWARRIALALFAAILTGGFFLGSIAAIIATRPQFAADSADALRAVIGDQSVAQLESSVFYFQDWLERAKVNVGLEKPASPWQNTETTHPSPVSDPSQNHKPINNSELTHSSVNVELPARISNQGSLSSNYVLTSTQAISTSTFGAPRVTPRSGVLEETIPPPLEASPSVNAPIAPTSSQMASAPARLAPWPPEPLKPLGQLSGEGVWEPYIIDENGQPLGYRTFLQPDPKRPYTIVGLVVIDLTRTRLHFVLGSIEPIGNSTMRRSGKIPDDQLAPGILLAAFNGGFKATHGHFGAMADGITAIPPRRGLGTIAIYKDGHIQMGAWGREITNSPDIVAWRQNGPLVIQNWQINSEIRNNSPADWGYTVEDVSPTLRSGLGISGDGQTLYYVVGPKMTMDALAISLQTAGAAQAIQLDINNYWVHFVAYPGNLTGFAPQVLLPDLMKDKIDRFLEVYPRDFFYITPLEIPIQVPR